MGDELYNAILGIIGCGRIGHRLSQIVIGFNMKVIGYDADLKRVKELYTDSRIEYLPLEDVLRNADYVSIHTGGKEVVIGAKELELMKPTAYLINVSRGANVDPNALYEALRNGKIAGAGLDVHIGEPSKDGAEFISPFQELGNVVLTSHLGASTHKGQKRVSVEMAKVVRDYLLKFDYTNALNVGETIEAEQIPTYNLLIVHKDVPGVFAKIDDILASCHINIREITSRKVIGENVANTGYILHQKPDQAVIDKIKQLDVVTSVKSCY